MILPDGSRKNVTEERKAPAFDKPKGRCELRSGLCYGVGNVVYTTRKVQPMGATSRVPAQTGAPDRSGSSQ